MVGKFLLTLVVLFWSLKPAQSQTDFSHAEYPMRIIFDSDFGPDYDDVGAITLLHSFADSGYIKILATMASSRHKNVAAALNVFNTYFKKPDIPIGVVSKNGLDLGDRQHWTDTVISRYPHHIESNDEVSEASNLYRQLLASQPDHSVTIITVGFLTNLANLLQSAPDSFSGLNGFELVKLKVAGLVCMGGRFPSGREFNLDQDVPSSKKVLEEWPTTILFSGFEIGQKIKSGLLLIRNEKIQKSPVKDVFSICIPMAKEDSAGRMSWDETAVYVAVKGWQPFYTLQTGDCEIFPDGSDNWKSSPGMKAHLVEAKPPQEISTVINQLMMHQP
jgi:inosine-uridine nucleoside N-ribohydrolase